MPVLAPESRLSHSGVRGTNRAKILQLLRRYQQLSRAEIARRSGLSEGTVSRIVAGLLRERLLVERGAASSTGGRPATRLEIEDSHLRAIGIEIQNWETRVVLGTMTGRAIETRSFRTPSSPLATLEQAAAECEALLGGMSADRIEGAGVVLRGVVNHQAGVVELGSTPAWTGVAVRQTLEPMLRLPVFVENNVRAAALAEYNHGSSDLTGHRCVLFLVVDDGIGTGIVIGGQLHRGPHMAAGEVGQMVVTESPGGGAQDRPGCLEFLASNPAMAERYAQLAGESRRSKSGDAADRVRTICHLAMQGNAEARNALLESTRYLGIGIANLVWSLDADAVVVDGAITEAWPLVSGAIQDQFPREREIQSFRNLLFRPSALGVNACLIGALTLPFGQLYSYGRRRSLKLRAS